jgi:hypothetical protein
MPPTSLPKEIAARLDTTAVSYHTGVGNSLSLPDGCAYSHHAQWSNSHHACRPSQQNWLSPRFSLPRILQQSRGAHWLVKPTVALTVAAFGHGLGIYADAAITAFAVRGGELTSSPLPLDAATIAVEAS